MDTKKIFFLLLIGMFMISMVSAFEFDNVKSYDSVTREVTIKNCNLWVGVCLIWGDTIGVARLNSPLNVIVPVGYQKVAEFDIWAYRDYNDALKQFTFKDMNNGKVKINRDYDLKYLDYDDVEVDDYEAKCESVFDIVNKTTSDICSNVKVGSHYEKKQVWKKITPADLKKNDKMTIGVFTEVQKGDYVDFIPMIYGVEVDEWATWTESLNTDILGYYDFDETTGTVLIDVTGNGNNGTNSNAIVNQSGILGKAYDFVSASPSFILFDTPLLDTISAFSISFWVNIDTIGQNQMLVSNGANTAGFYMYYGGCGANTMYVNFGAQGLSPHPSALGITQATWTHMVSTYDGADTYRLYIDGVGSYNNTAVTGELNATRNFTIGTWPEGSLYSDALFDEVGIWERELSVSEVQDLYNGGTGITYVGTFPSTPNITLNSPTVDANYTTVQNLIINFTVYDDINLSDVKLYINGALNQTNASGINDSNYLFDLGLYDGDYTINGVALNGDNITSNSSSVRIVINTIPFIEYLTPPTLVNNSNVTYNYVPIKINTTTSYLDNVTYYLENVNTTLYTKSYDTETYDINFTNVPDGNYSYNVTVYTTTGKNNNTGVRTIKIDTTSPVISLGNVTNLSTISNSTLQLNGTDTNIDNCYYNNTQNSTYIIVTCGSWFNITWTTAGSKDVQYCANDTFGQETCATSSLTVYNLSTSTTDSPDPVGELRPVQYDLIVREVVTTLPTTTANLVHNGTTYQLTAILTNSTEYHFQKNITMQDGWGSSTGNNISFNWAYNVSGLGEYTTSTENTTVLAVSFDDCTALGDVILNWSLHDEGNNSLVNATAGADVEIDLQVYDGTATTTWTHNETWTSKSAGAICVPTGLLTSSSDYVIDFTMGFQATDHVWEFFYLDNGNLNSTKIFDGQTNGNITLMDLLTADSTSFLFNYFDVDGLAVEDSIVHVFRKYIGEGTFREVERAKADDNGDATIHLVEEDVIYYFQITQYGVVLYTSNEYTALCQDTPCTIQLEASSGGSTFGTDWDLVDNGGYEIYTSSTTREVNLTYILTSPSTMNLTVFNYNSDGSYSVVNSSTDTGTTGSFIVTVPQSAGNVSFFATVYQDGEFINSEWVDFSGQASDYFGSTLALFLGALIILSLGLMSISEGAGTIIWIILGVFIAGGMGLIATGLNTGISITIYLICAGGILLWKLTRGRK